MLSASARHRAAWRRHRPDLVRSLFVGFRGIRISDTSAQSRHFVIEGIEDLRPSTHALCMRTRLTVLRFPLDSMHLQPMAITPDGCYNGARSRSSIQSTNSGGL